MSNGLELLPVKVQRAIYFSYGILTVVVGSIDAWYVQADPAWIQSLRRVVLFLGAPVLGLAVVKSRSKDCLQNENLGELDG